MNHALLALSIPPLLLLPTIGSLERVTWAGNMGNEMKRKAVHVGGGLMTLSLPLFLTAPWMVLLALVLVLTWMIAVRQIPSLRCGIGACLHDTQRVSYGEICFALSVASLLLLTSGRPLLFAIPLLILTLADAAAAIIGRLYPLGLLRGFARGKTASGCVAFAVVAFLITHTMLTSFTDMGFFHSISVALLVAVTSCIAEVLGKRGLDNLLIPAISYGTLLLLDIPLCSPCTGN